MAVTTNRSANQGGISFEIKPLYLVVAIACALAFAFYNGIENLFKRWGEQQELSHGYFLPVIAGWIIWERRDALLKSLSAPSTLGVVGVAASAIVLVLSEITVTSLMIFQHLAMVSILASLALALGGRTIFWLTAIPVAYLLFMVPPPYWAITVLSQQFQFMSSELGVAVLKALGIPVFLSGNLIDMGSYQLQVAEACSGLRYLFPFLSLGFLAAYLFKAPLWQRAVVFLSTIPITIFMNSLRIAVTGILVDNYGVSHAEGIVHFFEGWVVFIFCLILLFAVIAGLARLSGQKDLGDLLTFPEIQPKNAASPWTEPSFKRNALISLAIIVAAGAYVHFGTSNILRVPERADLRELPNEFSDWRAVPKQVDDQTLEVLGADDYIITDLVNPDDQLFNLYIAYLDMQRHGHSWHSPRQCIPGGGWQITSHEIMPKIGVDGDEYHYNRIVIENRGVRQLLYYWYDQRGRRVANEFVMKGLVVLDALRIQRTDGAMIRIMTTIPRGESMDEADQRLLGFMDTLEPKLSKYVPDETATATRTFDPDAY